MKFELQIYTYPALRGAPCDCRRSYHDSIGDTIAYLDSQTDPYYNAVVARTVPGRGYYPCDWDGHFIAEGTTWPGRRGTNGEHPAYLAFLSDMPTLIAEVRRLHDQTGGPTIEIADRLLKAHHPLISGWAASIGLEAAAAN